MTRVRSYKAFLEETGDLSREEFLERVTYPILQMFSVPDDTEAPIETILSNAPTPPSLTTSSGTWYRGPQGILPVVKAAGNPFGEMVTVGRAPNNDLVLNDKRVSKYHGYFQRCPGGWLFCDSNSTNGTAVDGSRVSPEEPIRLSSGSKLLFGDTIPTAFLEPAGAYELVQNLKAAIA